MNVDDNETPFLAAHVKKHLLCTSLLYLQELAAQFHMFKCLLSLEFKVDMQVSGGEQRFFS